MESVRFDRERGQILVQVAIMVGVLFAFAALAVDAGQVYGGRRRMQNAADAGALAGARAICFPTDGINPQDAAVDYAERNGARPEDVQVTIDDYTAIVTAAQTLDTFFAGVIGINEANVRAEAAARCGGTVAAGGVWPLAFRQDVYTDTERVPCGEQFLVFASKEEEDSIDWAPECCNCEESEVDVDSDCVWKDDCKSTCVLTDTGSTTSAFIGGGDRGWLLFDDPEGPYELPDGVKCPGVDACGEGRVGCWLANDYPGEVSIGDCVSGQPGVDAAVSDDVDERGGDLTVLDDGDVVQIILWDDKPCDLDEDDKCKKTPYHVAGFGCIQIVRWEQQQTFYTCGSPSVCAQPKAVRAIKICEGNPLYNEFCASPGGASGGKLPEDWEDRSVSLIEWPRPADE